MASSLLNLSSILSPSNLLNAAGATKQKAQAAATSSTGSTSTSTSSSGGLTGSSTGTTFLNLLVKELQNQDPDSPVDSTAMVGQMISLNQLDQLISINQVLSNATTTSATTTGAKTQGVSTQPTAGAASMSSVEQMAQRASLMNLSQNPSSMQAAQQAALNPAQTLDLSTLNIPNGGK